MCPIIGTLRYRYAVPGHPPGDERLRAVGGGGGSQQQGLRPTCRPVNNSEQVCESLFGARQRPDQVQVHVREPNCWHLDGLHRRPPRPGGPETPLSAAQTHTSRDL
jgi:hypothetical protein